jgi:anti-sigma regulatory factor (Ser/Thr protein kinase)
MVRSSLALNGASDKTIADAELLTSELVTNAVVHGHSAPRLVLEVWDDRIRVVVTDSDPRMTLEPLHVQTSSEHGRGLRIVDSLASKWGVSPWGRGKSVWFELDL